MKNMKYKEDSAFVKGVSTSLGDNPKNWKSKKFKYKWLELWSHSGTTKVGIADISKSRPLFWKTPDNLISGPTVIQTGFDNGEEWIRVVRKTADSRIING